MSVLLIPAPAFFQRNRFRLESRSWRDGWASRGSRARMRPPWKPVMPIGAESSSGVVVVADDLTGAADTAIHFLRPGEEIVLVSLANEAAGQPALPRDGLAIDTGTRGSSEAEAIHRLRQAAARLRE